MTESKTSLTRRLAVTAAVLVLVLLVLYLAGVFSPARVAPGKVSPAPGEATPTRTAAVTLLDVPVWYEAVGTVQPRTIATVSAQASGQITEIGVDAGALVESGQVLARQDDREMRARLEQARSGQAAAAAELDRAAANEARTRTLLAQNAATPQQMETASAALLQAQAALDASKQRVNEATTALGHAQILSPFSGIVAERRADPGDLAWPGKALFLLHDPSTLRLEAGVREGLIGQVATGQTVSVELSTLGNTVTGTVDEIVPLADPVSRSFRVKVALPPTPGLYPGMFGKLRIQVGTRPTLRIPTAAVSRIGQLNIVRVKQDDRWTRRHITLGRTENAQVEVLSGLREGDRIGWNEEAEHERD